MKAILIFLLIGLILISGCGKKIFTTTVTSDFSKVPERWDDVYVPLASAKAAGINDPDFNLFNLTTRAYEFQNNVLAQQDELYFTFQMPHKYKINSEFHAHLHYSYDSPTRNISNFSLTCTFANLNGAWNNTYNSMLTTASSSMQHLVSDFPLHYSCTTISCVAQCLLIRESAAVTDTYPSGVYVHAVDFHVLMDTLGSREEYVK